MIIVPAPSTIFCKKCMIIINEGILCNTCKREAKRLAARIKAANYKDNKCKKCSLQRNNIEDLDKFDFHHRQPELKSFKISDKISSLTWDKLQLELDKCDMLCAICHREYHSHIYHPEIVNYALDLIK
jgi:hypothetical protein